MDGKKKKVDERIGRGIRSVRTRVDGYDKRKVYRRNQKLVDETTKRRRAVIRGGVKAIDVQRTVISKGMARDFDEIEEAFSLYFLRQSIRWVSRQTGIAISTLYKYRAQHQWDYRVTRLRKQAQVQMDDAVVSATIRQARFYKMMQAAAHTALKNPEGPKCPDCHFTIVICPRCEARLPSQLRFKGARDIIDALDKSIKGERMVLGMSAAPYGQKYLQEMFNAIISRLGMAMGVLKNADKINDVTISWILQEFTEEMGRNPIMAQSVAAQVRRQEDVLKREKESGETVDAVYEDIK